jgi:hypothetical protein
MLSKSLNVEIGEALTKRSSQTLRACWREWDPSGDPTGQGYNRSPALPQHREEFLAELLDFIPQNHEFDIPSSSLKAYNENQGTRGAAWPRRETLYEAPLARLGGLGPALKNLSDVSC